MPRLYLLGGALRCGRLGRPARSGDSFTDSEPDAMAERRPERVAHLVQAELATLFLRVANDPRLRELTVTAVRMSAALRVARLYVRTRCDTGGALTPGRRQGVRAHGPPRNRDRQARPHRNPGRHGARAGARAGRGRRARRALHAAPAAGAAHVLGGQARRRAALRARPPGPRS